MRAWQRHPGSGRAVALVCAFVAGVGAPRARADAPARAPLVRVVAPHRTELAEDPSSFATRIEADDYTGEAATTEDLLSRSVGVQVRRFGGPGQRAEISVRGSSGSQVAVLLDGVPINRALTGGADLSTLPLGLVEAISVTRGAASAQHGSGALGGVVDVETRTPGAEARTDLRLSAASFGTWQGSFSHAQRFGSGVGRGADATDAAPRHGGGTGFGLLLGYDGFSTDGDWPFRTVEFATAGGVVPAERQRRINNRSERHATLLKLDVPLRRGLSLRAGNRFVYQSRGIAGFAIPATGRFASQNPAAHERTARNVVDLELRASDGPCMRARLFHRWERLRFRDPAPDGRPPASSDQRDRSLGFDLACALEGALGPSDQAVSARIQARRDAVDARGGSFVARSRWVGGAFVQDEIGLFDGRLRIVPGLRFDRSEGFSSEWLPRLGVVVDLHRTLRLKANYEEAYRIPSFDELFHPDEGFLRGNPSLRPEASRNADAGVEIAIARFGPVAALRLEASYFHQDIADTIVWVRVAPETIQPQNISDARVQGVELLAAADFGAHVSAEVNWTRLWNEVAGTGAVLVGRPDDEVSARLELGSADRRFKLTGELHHVSSIPTTRSGDSFVSGRTTLDVSVSLDVARWLPFEAHRPDRLRVGLAGTNLSDRSVYDAVGVPQPGRVWTVSLEAGW